MESPPIAQRTARLAALYLGIAAMLVALHAQQVDFEHKKERAERHALVLAGEGEAPWAYRVLTPAIAEALSVPIRTAGVSPVMSREIGYLIERFVAVAAFLGAFHLFLRQWLDPAWSTAGVLLAAAMTPASYAYYWFQPESPPDLALWAVAAVLTLRNRDGWLFPLIAIGALNRETAVFVVPIHLAMKWGKEPIQHTGLRAAALLFTFAVPFMGVRLWIGSRPWVAPIETLAAANLNGWWLGWTALCLAPVAVVPFLGLRNRPIELQRLLAVLVAMYVPLQLVFGRIREFRLLLPLVLVLVPLAMLALRESADER